MVRAMKRLTLFAILLNILFVSCANQSGNDPTREPVYLVTVKSPSDEVIIQNGDNNTAIDIHSVTGIGSAKFELESGDLPETLVARLHLGGLEEVRVSSDKTIIVASFSSGEVFDGSNQKITLSGKEYPITPAHPLWLNIRVVSNDMTPNIPLEEGYFEIVLPKEFIEESGNSFEIQWIDFYR